MIRYSAGVSCCRHSASDFSTFFAMAPPVTLAYPARVAAVLPPPHLGPSPPTPARRFHEPERLAPYQLGRRPARARHAHPLAQARHRRADDAGARVPEERVRRPAALPRERA